MFEKFKKAVGVACLATIMATGAAGTANAWCAPPPPSCHPVVAAVIPGGSSAGWGAAVGGGATAIGVGALIFLSPYLIGLANPACGDAIKDANGNIIGYENCTFEYHDQVRNGGTSPN